jgi:hypothetical protein
LRVERAAGAVAEARDRLTDRPQDHAALWLGQRPTLKWNAGSPDAVLIAFLMLGEQ